MEAYAVVQTGGKQYRVGSQDVLRIERVEAEAGQTIQIGPVLAVSDGNALTVGCPHVEGATVSAVVVKQVRGPKVVSFRRKRRKNYQKKIGHRQNLTEIKVETLPAVSTGA